MSGSSRSVIPGRLVHLAAGEHAPKFPGWFNVDGYPGPDVDLVLDLIKPGWAEELEYQIGRPEVVYVGHFLEHLTPDEADVFVKELREWMAPGGRAAFVGPDVAKARAMERAGLIPTSLRKACEAHGVIDPANPTDRRDVHAWNTTGPEIAQLLKWAGWEATECRIKPWPLTEVPCISDAAWQYLVIGSLKP